MFKRVTCIAYNHDRLLGHRNINLTQLNTMNNLDHKYNPAYNFNPSYDDNLNYNILGGGHFIDCLGSCATVGPR